MSCHDCHWPGPQSDLEGRQFAAKAACNAQKQLFKGTDKQDLMLKQKPLQNESPDASTSIYSSLGVLSQCFTYPRCFVAHCRQDLNFENPSSWREAHLLASPVEISLRQSLLQSVASSICYVSYFCVSHFKRSPCPWEGRSKPCRQELVCLHRNKAGSGF